MFTCSSSPFWSIVIIPRELELLNTVSAQYSIASIERQYNHAFCRHASSLSVRRQTVKHHAKCYGSISKALVSMHLYRSASPNAHGSYEIC